MLRLVIIHFLLLSPLVGHSAPTKEEIYNEIVERVRKEFGIKGQSKERYCHRYPTHEKCLGSLAHCQIYPYHEKCEGTLSHCQRLPHHEACKGSEPYCERFVDPENCSPEPTISKAPTNPEDAQTSEAQQ